MFNKLQQTLAKAASASVVDADGIPPGMRQVDLEMIGTTRAVQFSGRFYAMNYRNVTFTRVVRIVYALEAVLVLQDLASKSLYVVDRKTNISLGCKMHAELLPAMKEGAVRRDAN